MIFIDTNVIISYVNEDDSKHSEAKLLLKNIIEGDFGEYIISDYIFDETVTICELRVNKDESIRLGNFLFENLNIIKITDKLFSDSWKIFKENNKLSFTDCSNIAIMKAFGIKKIATFDKSFNKIKDIEIISQ